MKVLHLISGGDGGGAKTHLFALADKLKELAGIRVGCLMKGVFYQEIKTRNVDYCLFEQKNRFDLSVVRDIAGMIKREGFDILHAHGARANFVAMFLKRKIDVPIITTIHSDYLLDFDTFFKRVVFTTLNKIALKRIPYYIAVSDAFRKMLIERGFSPNNVYTVYNGMDFSAAREVTPREEFASRYDIDFRKEYIYVGIAARFDAVKGVDVFIRGAAAAAKQDPRLRFLIAGDGALKAELIALAKTEGIAEKTQFLGFVEDMAGFLNFIDINTLTSHCESFPYSMLEGAAQAVPIIASNVGGISALVKTNVTGILFEDNDFSSLAEAMVEMARSEQNRLVMGEALKARAQSEFSSEKFAARHMEIYRAVLNAYQDNRRYDTALSGYYGFHNSGDDALLAAILRDIKEQKSDIRPVVLSNKPKETQLQYGVDAVCRNNPISIFRALKQSKMLISGGGSLLQDETSAKSLWYYIGVIKAAKAAGLKVMQYANGVGPINREYNRRLCARVVSQCVDVITLRDRESAQLYEEIGVRGAILTADPAITLGGNSEIEKGSYICVSLRPWKAADAKFDAEIAQALDAVCEKEKLQCVFIPMQPPADIEAAERVARKMRSDCEVIEREMNMEETIECVRASRALLTMRLHPLIYALGAYVGTVGIVYDPKVRAFIEYSHSGTAIEISEASKAAQALEEAIRTGGSRDRADELCRLAKKNAQLAADLLEGRLD
ncbi:MAG: polysaccharide pyruvyl transferase CsaB [Clostridia bacterium]|nr:polysaccharide pyruvyl transferase CsaB [Clostridia bacterium]